MPVTAGSARRATRAKEAKQAAYRELVLEAALGLFAENGYDGTRMEEVAKTAGFAPATLYTVFRSKKSIYEAILEQGVWGILHASAERAREAASPWDAVLESIRGSHEYLIDHPDFLKVQLWETGSWAFEESAKTSAWVRAFDGMKTLYERCIEEGSVAGDDAVLMAQLTLAMQQTQLARWLETGATQPKQEQTEQMIALLARTFGA
jgi:AcrR family transcriptional regulator